LVSFVFAVGHRIVPVPSSPEKSLRIYLGDHLALMVAEGELAKRIRRENRQTPLAEFLDSHLRDLDVQRRLAVRALEAVGGRASYLKQAGGWMAEKFGRLKLNGGLVHYTNLSRVVELEGLLLLATSRRLMWQALATANLPQIDLHAAQETTATQIAQLEGHLASAHQRMMHGSG
jgi:hypothetical protein